MILENAPPVHVHNPRKIKPKHCGILVWEYAKMEYILSLRSGGLRLNWTPLRMVIRRLFIY